MKYFGLFLMLECLFLFAGVQTGLAGEENVVVRVAAFQGDRPAAITYTFDDGLRDQMELAVPMLQECGFHATFFVIPGRTAETPEAGAAMKPGEWGGISWPELMEISKKGHEIGNHSWHHENLTKLDDTRLEEEIEKGREEITTRMGKAPLIFCYPYNAVDERVRGSALKNHLGAREFQTGMGKKNTTETLNQWADGLVVNRKWGVAMIHGIAAGFDAFTSPDVLLEHLRYVKKREGDIWVDTFSNVFRYTKEKEGASLKTEQKPGQVVCQLDIAPDQKSYGVPLTIVVEARGVVEAQAIRGSEKLPVKIGPEKICVDVVPGPEPVTITWR